MVRPPLPFVKLLTSVYSVSPSSFTLMVTVKSETPGLLVSVKFAEMVELLEP